MTQIAFYAIIIHLLRLLIRLSILAFGALMVFSIAFICFANCEKKASTFKVEQTIATRNTDGRRTNNGDWCKVIR